MARRRLAPTAAALATSRLATSAPICDANSAMYEEAISLGFNEAQAQACSHTCGPMVVMAQAGSGKTKTLIQCVRNLASIYGQDRILAVTFSKKAADEMQNRAAAAGIDARFSTWHAFALSVLKEDKTPWAAWTIDDKDRFKYAIKDAIGYRYLDWKACDITKLSRFISTCKANALLPEDEGVKDIAAAIFTAADTPLAIKAYGVAQRIAENSSLLTFDDMLVFCHRWLTTNEEAKRKWSSRYDFVLQDEAQDTNPVQTGIARVLTSANKNYIIVGDPAQSIYGFRGSSPKTICDFEKDYPGCRVVYMCTNYRSGSSVVKVANDVIRKAAVRLPEDMIPSRDDFAGSVSVVKAVDFDDEARCLVSHIKTVYNDTGSYSNVTCLFRTNAQSRAAEEALLSAKIPYIIIGGTSFYERKEVKDLLAYLRIAQDVANGGPSATFEDAMKRSINTPFRYLGSAFVEELLRSRSIAINFTQTASGDRYMMSLRPFKCQRRQQESVNTWLDIVNIMAAMANDNAQLALTKLVDMTGYLKWLVKEEGEESIESSHVANVRELIRVAGRCGSCAELLVYIDKSIAASQRQRKSQQDNGDRVLLMSIHRSKGLEWPNVWVLGCNNKLLPHVYGDEQEERRLMYVAATRARDHLTLSYVSSFATAAGIKEAHPSVFLSDAGLVHADLAKDE